MGRLRFRANPTMSAPPYGRPLLNSSQNSTAGPTTGPARSWTAWRSFPRACRACSATTGPTWRTRAGVSARRRWAGCSRTWATVCRRAVRRYVAPRPQRPIRIHQCDRRTVPAARPAGHRAVDSSKKKELVLVSTSTHGGARMAAEGRAGVRARARISRRIRAARRFPTAFMTWPATRPGVSVGQDHDTPAFAVASIRYWWRKMGRRAYPQATELFITADAGGRNGYRCRAWKLEVQRFADETGLRVHVSHLPPGTSKWNTIEHRLFCHITENWCGTALLTFETIVDRIGTTRTGHGAASPGASGQAPLPDGRQGHQGSDGRDHVDPSGVSWRVALRTGSSVKLATLF